MEHQNIPKQLNFPNNKYKVIRNGQRGIVLRISRDFAGKILFTRSNENEIDNFELRQDCSAYKNLEHELLISAHLHDFELSVPKPVGIEKIALFSSAFPVFIMQYLPFPSGSDLGYYEYEIAKKLAYKEMLKSMNYDFVPGGDVMNPNNFLYDRINKKIYLIDFEFWTHPDIE